MLIKWIKTKNITLQKERNISFEQIADIILNVGVLDIIEGFSINHPKQEAFVIEYKGMVWIVPFDEKEDYLLLKTAYPSRKYTKKYKG